MFIMQTLGRMLRSFFNDLPHLSIRNMTWKVGWSFPSCSEKDTQEKGYTQMKILLGTRNQYRRM